VITLAPATPADAAAIAALCAELDEFYRGTPEGSPSTVGRLADGFKCPCLHAGNGSHHTASNASGKER
jgi:hypothetical protein